MNATTADARSTFTGQPGAGQLRRSGDDRMLAGVAGGIARYLGADVTHQQLHLAHRPDLAEEPQDGDDESIAAAWIARRQDRSR